MAIRFLTIWLTSVILVAYGCQSHSSKTNADISSKSKTKNMLPSEEDFLQLLKKEGIPAAYYYDSSLLETQMKYPGTIGVLDAFGRALPALFVHSDSVKQADDLFVMVTTQPESFGLSAHPTDVEVKQAILNEMKKDTGMTFYLLPENTETGSPEGVSLFPPEYGETVKDYWIWYLKCNFFPGPVWLLVKRDGSNSAYHYGYM